MPRQLLFAFCALAALSTSAAAQPTLPESIYWRQNLFLIPYQWDTSSGGGQSVVLYVSKDRGATWQSISEAQPHVRAFNYRAETDGEFWFAIRTLDDRGNTLPTGPMQPELRVVVDTTMPRIDELVGVQDGGGTLEVRWRVADLNFDPQNSTIEAQLDREGNWQPVPMTAAAPATLGVWEGRAAVPLAPGCQATAVRMTAFDLARNRSIYQSSVQATAADLTASTSWPAIISGRGDLPTTAAAASAGLVPQPAAAPQAWPADRVAREWPEFSGGEGNWPSEAVTYGTPATVGPSPAAEEEPFLPPPQPDDRPLGDVPFDSRPPFAPLEPFREASLSRERADATTIATLPLAGSPLGSEDFSWLNDQGVTLPPGTVPKLVNTRTFALDYELDQPGHEGVVRVELWGSRDGGQSWQKYADDEDNRSPIVATVDGEGLYGVRLVVQSAAGKSDFPPQPGDVPEIWVGVDQHRPVVTLTSVEPAAAGEIALHWEADDDNLLARSIALFYSSRPSGPWTAIATNLANTGQHAWRPERHVPPRVYLRLEARDTAGNLAAFQTSESLSVEPVDSVARAAEVQSVTSATPWSSESSH